MARNFVRVRGAALSTALAMGLTVAAPAFAAPTFTTVNADLSSAAYSFSFMGGTFTFDGFGGFPNYLGVSTSGGAAIRTVFGNPSTDFTNRGTVVYDANTLGGYGSFPNRTTVPFTNGENFLGLRVTSAGQDYYGFAYTTDTVLNGFAFENLPGVGITATTDFGAAVPEPGAWALLILGFGMVGAASRRARRSRTSVAYA